MELKKISELVDKVKSGEIDESRLEVRLDNDMTSFHIGDEEIKIEEGGGYYDIEPLYRLLFPKASVEWV